VFPVADMPRSMSAAVKAVASAAPEIRENDGRAANKGRSSANYKVKPRRLY